MEKMVETADAGKARGFGAGAFRFAVALGCAWAVVACSEGERCEADKTLAQACAGSGDCPDNLGAAIAKGQACEGVFYEMWRDGDRRAIGVNSGYGARLYHFEGARLVGIHSWTDQLGGACPSNFVNGKVVLRTPTYPQRDEAETVEYCVLCPDWQIDDRPLCTAAQLGEPG